ECVMPWHPPSSLPKPGTKVFVLGEDPLRSNLPYWGVRADMVIPGELRTTLEVLRARLGNRGQTPIFRRPSLPQATQGMNNPWNAERLNAAIQRDAVVGNETITHRLELVQRLTKLAPGGFYEASFGALGMRLSLPPGENHAQRGRPVIPPTGDGPFHYNPVPACFGASQELELP